MHHRRRIWYVHSDLHVEVVVNIWARKGLRAESSGKAWLDGGIVDERRCRGLCGG